MTPSFTTIESRITACLMENFIFLPAQYLLTFNVER